MNATMISVNFVKTPANLFAKSGPERSFLLIELPFSSAPQSTLFSVFWASVGDKHHDVVNIMFFHQGDWS